MNRSDSADKRFAGFAARDVHPMHSILRLQSRIPFIDGSNTVAQAYQMLLKSNSDWLAIGRDGVIVATVDQEQLISARLADNGKGCIRWIK